MEVSLNQFWRTATAIEDRPAGINRTTPRFKAHGVSQTASTVVKRVLSPAWSASMWCCEIIVRRGDLPCQDPSTPACIIKEG